MFISNLNLPLGLIFTFLYIARDGHKEEGIAQPLQKKRKENRNEKEYKNAHAKIAFAWPQVPQQGDCTQLHKRPSTAFLARSDAAPCPNGANSPLLRIDNSNARFYSLVASPTY